MAAATGSPEAQRAAGLCAALTLVAAAALGLYQIGWGQRFAGHGMGKGDSYSYAALARDFPGVVFGKQIDAYRLQRVLPSGVVYAGLSLLGLPRDNAHVVQGFLWLNLCCMLGMLFLWHRIADAVRVSHAGRWLGCLLLFGNFACLRAAYYSPVMTDYAAAALGALLLYGFVRERTGLMFATLLLAAFTWPALFFGGVFLVAFPRRALPPEPATRAQRWFLAGAAITGFVAAFAARLRFPFPEIELDPPAFGWGGVWLHRELLPVSLPLALLYVGFVAANLSNRAALLRPRSYRELASRRALFAFAALFLLTQAAATGLAAGIPTPTDPLRHIQEIAANAVMRPANSWVAHAVAFGALPVLLTAVAFRACRAVHALGLGFTLFVLTITVLALTCESRQLMHSLAPLTLVAVLALEDVRFPAWARWALAILAFVASKLWFDINQTGFFAGNHPFSYPAQNFWMHVGLWMSDASYWRQGGVALLALALLVVAVGQARVVEDSERAQVWPTARTVMAFPATALVAAASFGAIELGARLVLSSRAPAPDLLSTADPALGWRNVPRASGRPASALVAFDSRGLRGPERDYAKPPRVRRVLLLGGSIVEGWNVEEAATLRAGLERAIAESCGTVEVLNAGVAGYAVDQQLARYQGEARRYTPDLVVAVVHYLDLRPLLDDPEQPHAMPLALRAPRRNMLYWRGSAALRLLSDVTLDHAPALHRGLGGLGIVDSGEPPPELWPFSVRDEAKAAAARFDAELGRLASAVEASGGRLVVLYAPARFELDDSEWEALLHRYVMSRRLYNPARFLRKLERVTEELELPFVNPLPDLQSETTGASAYDPATGLWSAQGYSAASHALVGPVTQALGCGAHPR